MHRYWFTNEEILEPAFAFTAQPAHKAFSGAVNSIMDN